jgi:hypothetical protein
MFEAAAHPVGPTARRRFSLHSHVLLSIDEIAFER